MAKIPNNIKKLPDFSFDFLSLLDEKNSNKLKKELQEEFIQDCHQLKYLQQDIKSEDIWYEYLINFISKYSLFIYHFEIKEQYEDCGEIKKTLMVLIKSFSTFKDETIDKMINSSTQSYRKIKLNTITNKNE